MKSQNVWMVRAGEGGSHIEEFERGYVAIGWNDVGDLSQATSLETIRELYLRAFPDDSPGKTANAVAVLYKFRCVIEKGENVVTYDPRVREYLIGTVQGDYVYSPQQVGSYSHTREVKWVRRVSRDDLTVASRNSLGSTLTLFSINAEVWADLASEKASRVREEPQEREEERDELRLIREETVGRAHELIKDRILKLDADELEELCAAILRAMGYRARVSPKGPDRGVDVTASPDGLGLEQPRIKAEVKHRKNTSMGPHEIRSFIGGLREGDRGLYVSTGGFTKEANYEADRSSIPITLLDLDDLAELLVTHYESFDSEGRALIPLVQVYWPAE